MGLEAFDGIIVAASFNRNQCYEEFNLSSVMA